MLVAFRKMKLPMRITVPKGNVTTICLIENNLSLFSEEGLPEDSIALFSEGPKKVHLRIDDLGSFQIISSAKSLSLYFQNLLVYSEGIMNVIVGKQHLVISTEGISWSGPEYDVIANFNQTMIECNKLNVMR